MFGQKKISLAFARAEVERLERILVYKDKAITKLNDELADMARDIRVKAMGETAHDELMRLRGEIDGLKFNRAPEAFNQGFANRSQQGFLP